MLSPQLFAILQKYDFSSKSQQKKKECQEMECCLRYCKSTIFQANHNIILWEWEDKQVVCDTAKVRFFKQITTKLLSLTKLRKLFAILQKYDFSSKSQPKRVGYQSLWSCLRYCKSTIFQANHNSIGFPPSTFRLFAILQKYDFSSKSQHETSSYIMHLVVCDTAKVRFFKQITTMLRFWKRPIELFAILQKYDFSSKSQQTRPFPSEF